MFKCKKCQHDVEMNVFVPFVNPNKKWAGDPAWVFHIKSICFKCHSFNGFKKQTPELMEGLRDNTLMNLNLEPRDLPFSDEESLGN